MKRNGVELMNHRTRNVSIARATLEIIRQGSYLAENGTEVSIAVEQTAAAAGTVLYTDALPASNNPAVNPTIAVVNQTTTQGGRQMLDRGLTNVAVLNFASGVNVGGGFLGGAAAQEEDLCRASGLYECIRQRPMFYNRNILAETPLYTDGIVYSPDVPFFRGDDMALLDRPYRLSVITAPAPNVSSMRNVDSDMLGQLFTTRATKVLRVAEAHGHRNLVLGAWGCGAFGNDPRLVAKAFVAALAAVPAFEQVLFSVWDTREPPVVFETFREVLAGQ